MVSFRKRVVAIESELKDRNELTPKNMREYTDLLDKVTKVGIEGYTDIHITIRGRKEELEDLAAELQTWTPGPGWSKDAQKLFAALRGEEVSRYDP